MIFGEYFPNPGGKPFTDEIRARVSPLAAFAIEAVGTAILVLVILSVTDERNASRPRELVAQGGKGRLGMRPTGCGNEHGIDLSRGEQGVHGIKNQRSGRRGQRLGLFPVAGADSGQTGLGQQRNGLCVGERNVAAANDGQTEGRIRVHEKSK